MIPLNPSLVSDWTGDPMREFFRGWKRKAGVVTLLLACVFAAGWVRGLATEDCRVVNWGTVTYNFVSDQHGIRVLRAQTQGYSRPNETMLFSQPVDKRAEPLEPKHYPRRWGFGGIQIGRHDLEFVQTVACNVPHWVIVLPLTLFSAYLLLSKPKPKSAPPAP